MEKMIVFFACLIAFYIGWLGMELFRAWNTPYQSRLIRLAWYGRCEGEHNWALTQRECTFYAIKAILCIIFNRYKAVSYSEDFIIVAAFDYHENYGWDGPSADWEDLIVGHGLFHDWRFSIERDGY